MKSIVIGSVFFGLAACACCGEYDVKLRKPQDSVVISERNGRTLLTVVSPSGIGTATLALKSGTWPAKITIRFIYTGKMNDKKELDEVNGFKMLEGISVKVDGKETKELKRHERKRDGTVEVEKGFKEVDLPDGCTRDAKTLTIEWVDAYRT